MCPSQSVRLCKQLSEQLANPQSTDAIRLFALMTLGELGRRCPDVYVQQDIRLVLSPYSRLLILHIGSVRVRPSVFVNYVILYRKTCIYLIHFSPEQLIVDAFNSSNEDLKSGAAYALGAIAVSPLLASSCSIVQSFSMAACSPGSQLCFDLLGGKSV